MPLLIWLSAYLIKIGFTSQMLPILTGLSMRESSNSEVRTSSFSSSATSCKKSKMLSPSEQEKKKNKKYIYFIFSLPLVVVRCLLIKTYVLVLNLS